MHDPARRLLALVAAFLLFAAAALPALAAGPSGPQPDAPRLQPGALKHPILDSRLVALGRRAAEGLVAPEQVAREARVSRGDSVGVSIRTSGDPSAADGWLRERGAEVVNVGERVIEGYVPVTELEALAGVAGVLAVRELRPPLARVVSQGAALHGAPDWNAGGYTGAGVKVGVIDVGFQGFTSLIGRELPEPVARCYRSFGQPTGAVADCERDSVHGTAVAETLLDVSPGVTLYIANPQSWRDLHATVEWMAAEGVRVINHSVGWYWEGPGDGTSHYSDGALAAVDKAVAAGVTWVNAAGNEGQSTWEGAASDADADGLLEYSASNERNSITTYAGYELTVQLRWDDSWQAAGTDIDLYLVDSAGNPLTESEMAQSGAAGNEPYEVLSYTPSTSGTLYLQVRHFSGMMPDWVQLQAFSGEPLQQRGTSGSIGVPAESANPGLLAAGAAPWDNPYSIEAFSSRGPTRDGRVKPDIVGIDSADTVSYGPSGFPGTSQAAPHVAGLAALVLQRFPGYAPQAVAQYLKSNATPTGGPSPNNTWGHGLAFLPEVQPGEHPLPVITGISPERVPIGAYPLTVTIDGAGFVPGSVARWNGGERPTTYVSPTQLLLEARYLDADYPHTVEITVFNPVPGGGLSNTATLVVDTPIATDDPAFEQTWARTDYPVLQRAVSRTWLWGERPVSPAILEPYAESPLGARSVKYFDKSRMEVTDPDEDPEALWYVTNGLLVMELISGRMQIGDAEFEEREPAEVNLAGDQNDPDGPTYATFGALLDAAPLADGATITHRLARDGSVLADAALAAYGATAAYRIQVEGIDHQVASPFWEFMTSEGTVWEDDAYTTAPLFENPFYATGYPVTEAYWATVRVAGIERDVLMQCFERRCLTYTPANPPGWQVEAGNVGRHYYRWRYGEDPAP